MGFHIVHMKGQASFYHHIKRKSGKIIISRSIWVKAGEFIVNLSYMIKFQVFLNTPPPPSAKVWPQCIYVEGVTCDDIQESLHMYLDFEGVKIYVHLDL